MKTLSKNNVDHTLFRETWSMLHTNPRMFDYWLKKSDLTIHERRLLKCFNLYRKNKKKECIELLKNRISSDQFLEGVRCYLKGLIYNQHSHCFYAIEHLEASIEIFKTIGEVQFLNNSLFLIAIVYGNRRETNKMAAILDDLVEFDLVSNSERLQLIYAQLFYFVLMNQKENALAACTKAEKLNYAEYESYHSYFLVQKFMLFAKNKEYKNCYKVLEDYKKISGNTVKANYVYMNALLGHIDANKPLYVYAKDYAEFPELYEQLEVIKNLKDGEIELAKSYWQKLSKHNPFLYGENFTYYGDENLFAQALKRYLVHSEEMEINEEQLDRIPKLMDKLQYIVENANRPLDSFVLISLIWKEEYSQAALTRLRKLVFRYNQQSSFKIIVQNGTYKLEKSSSKTA
jgi:hypothetical protein